MTYPRTRARTYQTSSRILKLTSVMESNRKKKTYYLVFYGRRVMQGLRLLAASRGWNMINIKTIPDTSEGLRELQRLISPSRRFLVVYTTAKAYRHAVIRELATSKDALVAPIENIHKVTGPKRAQITSLRPYQFDVLFHEYGDSIFCQFDS